MHATETYYQRKIEALERVEALHEEEQVLVSKMPTRYAGVCAHSGETWPCATQQAIGNTDGTHMSPEQIRRDERAKIVAYLQREMTAAIREWEDGEDITGQTRAITLDIAWQQIQRGDHNAEEPTDD